MSDEKQQSLFCRRCGSNEHDQKDCVKNPRNQQDKGVDDNLVPIEVKKELVVANEANPAEASEPPLEMVVVAHNPQEMKVAQQKLVEWSSGKVASLKKDKEELEENLAIAKKNKWRTNTLIRHVGLAQKNLEYYEKIHAALEAGYVIVPNFPVDVFAIRTTRKNPKENFRSTKSAWGGPPSISDQASNRPPVGEGRYVNSQAVEKTSTNVVEHKPNEKPVYQMARWAEKFGEVDFPFSLAKPRILESTAKAMAHRIFDDLGILPARQRAAGGDPMVIGRIIHKRGYNETIVSFMVAWFIDTKDL